MDDQFLEMTPKSNLNTGDPGLAALLMILRYHGLSAEPEQILHQFGASIGILEIVRCARGMGLAARARTVKWRRLSRIAMPCIGVDKGGGFILLGKVTDNHILVQSPMSPQPKSMDRAEFEALWDGCIITIAQTDGLGGALQPFNISWFFGAMRKYRRLLTEVVVASFFLQLLALASPLFFQVIIDKVLVHRSMSTLEVLAIALVGIAVFEALLGGIRTHIFSHTTNRIDVELGARLFRHLMALPLAYFQVRRVGDSIARMRELESIRNFLTSSALTLVMDLFFTVVFIAVMFVYSSSLTWIVVGSIVVYIAISAGATPVFRRNLDDKFRLGAENQAFLVENVTGIETLKAMAVEPQMQRRWEHQLAAYVAASFRVSSIGNAANQLVQLVNKLFIVVVLYIGTLLVVDGVLTIGELVAFNMLLSRVTAPVLRLAQIWQDFHQTRLSVTRLGDILNTPAERAFRSSRSGLPPIKGAITFDRVDFRYRADGLQVLRNVNLEIPAGQVVGIVGTSGSGKSTLTKLVQRLYLPERGRVLVDGFDLATVDPAWLRRQIGVVLQDNILFNRSVRDNIALADPTIPMEQVIAAAQSVGAHDFILELPFGYDSIVGERGESLSGGQRQRIAFARALVTEPRILILDEATSALDYDSERIIQQRLRAMVKGRTVLIVTHRLTTVRHADRIISVEDGSIVEDGSYAELMSRGGRFAAQWRLQGGLHEVG